MYGDDTALESLKAQVRPRLLDFLREKGVEVSENGMLVCLHPMHQDTNASMKVISDMNNEELYCYGCGIKGDIFSAHSWLDDVSNEGLSFIKDNVYHLADKYSIQYEEMEFTAEQLEVMEQIKLNKLICDMLTATDERGSPVGWTNEHAVARGWKPEVCRKLRIATVLDYDRLMRSLTLHTGMDREQLRKERGVRGDLFGPDYITIPIFDERGQPIGFTARWLKWEKGAKQPKYVNSNTSATFQKGKVLYGLHLCRDARGRRLDVFEGNGSFITAFGAGHKSCVALCSSGFTEDQINLIQRMGFKHVNLCLDGDSTGRKQTGKYMKQLSGREGLKVSFTRIPDDMDPDDLIQAEGLEALYKLGTTSAFAYFLENEAESAKRGDVVPFITKMVKVIQNTENRVERGKQLAELAAAVEVPEEDIRAEMRRVEALNVASIKDQITKGVRFAQDTDELLSTLDTVRRSVESQGGGLTEREALSSEESLSNFKDLCTILSNRKSGIQGWKTGFPLVDMRLSGIPKPVGKDDQGNDIPIPGALVGFAGAPQHGKTTVLQAFELGMAMNNDDITMLSWSLDDARERRAERAIAMHSGVDWRAVTRRVPPNTQQLKKIAESAEIIGELMRTGRLIFKDQSNGSTIPFLTRWVEHAQKEYGRPVCVVIDSFHKIGASGDEAAKTDFAVTKKHSQDLKALYKTHNITIMASLELNKGASRGSEPDLLAITEARKIEYDFDVVATVFNHYYDMDGASDAFLDEGGLTKPLIKVNFKKSKEGGTGPVFFALNPLNFRLSAYSLDEVTQLTSTEEVKPVESGNVTINPPDTGSLKAVNEPWAS